MDVRYPGFGSIVVDGATFDHDVVIEDGRVRARDKAPSKALKTGGHTPLSLAEEIPWSKSRLIIGSGYSERLPVLPEVVAAAETRQVRVEIMATAQACAALRGLDASEVNAILHVTC